MLKTGKYMGPPLKGKKVKPNPANGQHNYEMGKKKTSGKGGNVKLGPMSDAKWVP